jgi:hypothetical protein
MKCRAEVIMRLSYLTPLPRLHPHSPADRHLASIHSGPLTAKLLHHPVRSASLVLADPS